MKLLFVEPFGHREGHFSVYPNYMSRAMLDAGMNVNLVSFDGVLGGWLEKENRITHRSACNLTLFGRIFRLLANMMRCAVPLRPFGIGFECFLTYLVGFYQNRKSQYDVLHILDTAAQSLFFLSFAAIVKGHNLVITLHGPSKRQEMIGWPKKFGIAFRRRDYLNCFYLLSLKFSESHFLDNVWRFLYRRGVRRNHLAFICLSEETKRTYQHTPFYDKITYIPDARPRPSVVTQGEAKNHLGLPPKIVVFLSFGINHPTKCFEVIFKAVKDLPYDFRLLFAGKILPESPADNDPRCLSEKYGLAEKTIIVDSYINDTEMVHYFCAADVFLLSYRNVSIDASGGFSYAYQCGLPSISVDTGRMGDTIKSHNLGFTFIPEDETSLRKSILEFLKLDANEKQALKRNILQYADSSNNWQQMTKGYLDLYKSLLS
jgi:glycosyltransferase involved in cell wall biosynthesis